ncbi:hypothetical protein JW935_13450, partial [candidate division KSB1 bacterium]|nr:hypothetical protein [candidate division KSB1 bacterium]
MNKLEESYEILLPFFEEAGGSLLLVIARLLKMFIKKCKVVLFFILLCSHFCRPVDYIHGTVTGRVTDKITQQPLEFVNVFLANT